MKERGSAAILAAAVAGLLAVSLVGGTSLALAYTAREAAATAAEAAALGAAVATYPGTGRPAPAGEASRIAAANGARLESCWCRTDASLTIRTVTVRTSVDITVPIFGRLRIPGTARAEFDPMAWLGA